MKINIEKHKTGIYFGFSYTGNDWAYFKVKSEKDFVLMVKEMLKQIDEKEQLLKFYDKHKKGKIHICHDWNAISPGNTEITIEDLVSMVNEVCERDMESVRQD